MNFPVSWSTNEYYVGRAALSTFRALVQQHTYTRIHTGTHTHGQNQSRLIKWIDTSYRETERNASNTTIQPVLESVCVCMCARIRITKIDN